MKSNLNSIKNAGEFADLNGGIARLSLIFILTSGKKAGKTLRSVLPITKWVPEYDVKRDLLNDIAAGITVGIVHLPQGMSQQCTIANFTIALLGFKATVRLNLSLNGADGPVGESVCLGSCRFGFDSESGQTNNCKIGIHSFPA